MPRAVPKPAPKSVFAVPDDADGVGQCSKCANITTTLHMQCKTVCKNTSTQLHRNTPKHIAVLYCVTKRAAATLVNRSTLTITTTPQQRVIRLRRRRRRRLYYVPKIRSNGRRETHRHVQTLTPHYTHNRMCKKANTNMFVVALCLFTNIL